LLLAAINLIVFLVILLLNTRLSPLMLGALFIGLSIGLATLLFIVNRDYHSLKNKQKIRHIINEIHKKH
jgi:glycosyl transferase family 4